MTWLGFICIQICTRQSSFAEREEEKDKSGSRKAEIRNFQDGLQPQTLVDLEKKKKKKTKKNTEKQGSRIKGDILPSLLIVKYLLQARSKSKTRMQNHIIGTLPSFILISFPSASNLVQDHPNRRSLSPILLIPSHALQSHSRLVTSILDTHPLDKHSISLFLNLGKCPAFALITFCTHQLLNQLCDRHHTRHVEGLCNQIGGNRTFPHFCAQNDV